jgi:ferritin
MPEKAVLAGINEQIGKEFAAAYLYLAMAAYFERNNLPGFAHWMRMQHQEETGHALRLFDYLLDRGAPVELDEIPKPPAKFKSPLDVLERAFSHEEKVTASINHLYELAVKSKDYPTQIQLQWFIAEQVEEEKMFSELVARVRMAGDSGSALFFVDRELAGRATQEPG